MKLAFTKEGSGPPLVFLHGLFGQGNNWGRIRRLLADSFTIITPDLRNHGNSPHSDRMDYPAMADDVIGLIREETGGSPVYLAGHSMGGKVAMYLALQAPELVRSLIIVDIIPRSYPPHHRPIIEGMRRVDLSRVESRRDADRQLAEFVSDAATRAFLLMNLDRPDAGGYRWKLNLDALSMQYDQINGWPSEPPYGPDRTYDGEVLLIYGEHSEYVRKGDQDLLRKLFSRVRSVMIEGTGHLVHAERPEQFAETVRTFLSGT